MQIFPNTGGMTALGSAQAQDASSSSDSSSSTTNSATVTANDFLQLLVTEMQNQDPTADTDPNEYINQLVQVNSLQQLIQINQDLTTVSSSGSGDESQGVTASSAGNAGPQDTPATATASGNLSAPPATPASSRVANALGAAAQQLSPGSLSTYDSLLSAVRARAQQAGSSPSTPAH